jgi:hypothetical protein
MRRNISGQVDHHFVYVTPAPTLGLVVIFHDRMLSGVKMTFRVLADGIVATSNVPADAADTKMDPRLTDLWDDRGAFANGGGDSF